MTGGALLAALGWYQASNEFVSKIGASGAEHHPSPYNWVFWLCVVFAGFGFLGLVSTYVEPMPWIGKDTAIRRDRVEIEEAIAFALVCEQIEFDIQLWPKRGHRLILFSLIFENGRNEIIEYQMLDAKATFEGYGLSEKKGVGSTIAKVLPVRKIIFHLPPIEVPDVSVYVGGQEFGGDLEFSVLYGNINGGAKRLKRQKWQYQMAVRDDGVMTFKFFEEDGEDAVAPSDLVQLAAKLSISSPIS